MYGFRPPFVSRPPRRDEWKSLRPAANVGKSIGLTSFDHSSLSKHLKGLEYVILKRILDVFIGKLNRAARRKL